MVLWTFCSRDSDLCGYERKKTGVARKLEDELETVSTNNRVRYMSGDWVFLFLIRQVCGRWFKVLCETRSTDSVPSSVDFFAFSECTMQLACLQFTGLARTCIYEMHPNVSVYACFCSFSLPPLLFFFTKPSPVVVLCVCACVIHKNYCCVMMIFVQSEDMRRSCLFCWSVRVCTH